MHAGRARTTVLWLVAVMAVMAGGRVHGDVILFPIGGDIPSQGAFITRWGASEIGVISDGTSNTIAFGETSPITLCFDGVSVNGGVPGASIADGSSNTIQFGESGGVRVNVGRVLTRRPISEIADGTSNTIQLGETSSSSFCLEGVTAAPDTTDGSSNTILIGEASHVDLCGGGSSRICVEQARVTGSTPVSVPEPATATLLLAGLGASGLFARWRARRRHQRSQAG